MRIDNVIQSIQKFRGDSLKSVLAALELSFTGRVGEASSAINRSNSVKLSLLAAAFQLKHAAAQIDEIVHAVGILCSLPEILKKEEVIQSLSLGAGNTGKHFDLETNQRIAEYKFIQW